MAGGEIPKNIKASLYIDGKPAENSIKNLTQITMTLRRELNGLAIGTDEFNKKAEEFKNLSKYLQDMKAEAAGVGDAFSKVRETIGELAESVAIGTLISQAIRGALASIQEFIAGTEKAYEDATGVQIGIINKLKQTGMVAGETEQQLKKYQETLSAQTGIEQDVIAKGEDVLLTYTNIRGYIFAQSIPAALNLTAAENNGRVTMDTMAESSKKLALALDNPREAKKKLKEMGIDLNNQQEQEIITLQKSNQLQKAQQIILDEVNKRFGNLTKTISGSALGPMQRFNTELHETQENFGVLIERTKGGLAEAFEPFLSWLEKASETDMPAKLREEQGELNGLIGAIVSTNDNQTVRNHLIDELQAKYPDFIGNINKETTANDYLVKKLEEANTQYRNKIFMATNEAKIKDIQEERNAAVQEEAEARERVAKASGLSAEALAKLTDQEVKNLSVKVAASQNKQDKDDHEDPIEVQNKAKLYQEDVDIILNGRKAIEESFKKEADLRSANAVYEDKVAKQQIADIDEQIAAIKKRMETEKEAAKVTDQAELNRLEQSRKTLTGQVDAPQSGPTQAEIDEAKRKWLELQKQKREYILQSQALTAQYGQFTAAQLAETLAKNDKEVHSVKNKYDAEIQKQKEFIAKSYDSAGKLNPNANAGEVGKHQDEINKLKIQQQQEVNALIAKQQQDLNTRLLAFNDALNAKLQSERDKEIDSINKFYDQQEKDAGNNADQLIVIDQKRQEALNDARLNEEKRFKQEKEKIDEGGDGVNVDKDKLALIKINKKYDDEISALKEKFSKEFQLTKQFNDAIALLNKQRDAELKASGKTDMEREENAAINVAQTTADAIMTITNRNNQASSNAKIKSLEDQKDKELSNTNLTAAQKDAINQKYAKQEAAIKLQQWKAEQAAAAEQALINGAIAFTKLWIAYPGGFANPLFDAAAIELGVSTAAQEAIILSQQTPQFADGGMTNTNPAGYVSKATVFNNSASGRNFVAGEAGTEWIAPNWMVKSPRYANIIGMLESSRQQKTQGYAAGGFNGNSNSTGNNSNRLDRIEAVLSVHSSLFDRQAKINAIPVVLSRRVEEQEDAKVAAIRDAANAS